MVVLCMRESTDDGGDWVVPRLGGAGPACARGVALLGSALQDTGGVHVPRNSTLAAVGAAHIHIVRASLWQVSVARQNVTPLAVGVAACARLPRRRYRGGF